MPRMTVSAGDTVLKLNEASSDLADESYTALSLTGQAFAAGGTGDAAGGMDTATIRVSHTTAMANVATSLALLRADLVLMGNDLNEVRQRANRLIRSMTANGILPTTLRTDRPLPEGATIGVAVTEIAAATLTVPAVTYAAFTADALDGSEAGCWDTEAERDTALTELVDDDDDNDALEVEMVLMRADIELHRVELNHLLAKAMDVGLIEMNDTAGDLNNT